MKRFLLLLPASVLLLASCKEVPPIISFGTDVVDTAFIAPVEAVQQRIVLIEEFTGVTCPNCPEGHKTLKAIEDANPDRVLAIGIQPFNFTQAEPVNEPDIKTKHDNRSQKGTALINGVYGSLSAAPQAGIDRVPLDGSLYTGRGDWPSLVSNRLTVSSPANIKITCTYQTNKTVIIKVHVAYTSEVSKNQLLNVAIVEDKIIDAQEQATTPAYIEDYEHRNVLRDILTSPTGTVILSGKATKVAGQVYERTFTYDLKTADPADIWNPDNCRVIAYVTNDEGADKEVVQAASAHLK